MRERKKVVPLQPQNDASVAQLVEHLTLNQGVQGSTPCGSTRKTADSAVFFMLKLKLVEIIPPLPFQVKIHSSKNRICSSV